jgi:hypothetical protein
VAPFPKLAKVIVRPSWVIGCPNVAVWTTAFCGITTGVGVATFVGLVGVTAFVETSGAAVGNGVGVAVGVALDV